MQCNIEMLHFISLKLCTYVCTAYTVYVSTFMYLLYPTVCVKFKNEIILYVYT